VEEPRTQIPGLPGRKPLSKGRRNLFALILAAALLITVATVVIVATTSSNPPPPRVVTLSAADRSAPRSLIAAALGVGFTPSTGPGIGTIEDAPAAAATAASNGQLLPVGSLAPAFTLKTPAGQTVRLGDFRGKAVLLELFATWCPHCDAEAPHLRKLAETLPKSKVAFVAVDGNGEDAPTVFAYHVHYGLPFPALLDPVPGATPARFPNHGTSGPVSRAYRLAYFPTFYVIDPKGRIAWRSDGEQPDALLRQELLRAAGA
jgi:thiol-disulfide isomerase/thioredoxin